MWNRPRRLWGGGGRQRGSWIWDHRVFTGRRALPGALSGSLSLGAGGHPGWPLSGDRAGVGGLGPTARTPHLSRMHMLCTSRPPGPGATRSAPRPEPGPGRCADTASASRQSCDTPQSARLGLGRPPSHLPPAQQTPCEPQAPPPSGALSTRPGRHLSPRFPLTLPRRRRKGDPGHQLPFLIQFQGSLTLAATGRLAPGPAGDTQPTRRNRLPGHVPGPTSQTSGLRAISPGPFEWLSRHRTRPPPAPRL